MAHIFISYAKQDTRPLAQALRQQLSLIPTLSAWMDSSIKAGHSWESQIQAEMDKADYVVVLLSRDLNRPETSNKGASFVLNEIEYALTHKKPILPVRVHPDVKIPLSIIRIQYVDLTETPDDPAPIVAALLERLQTQRARLSINQPPLPPKPQPQRPRWFALLPILGLLLLLALIGLIRLSEFQAIITGQSTTTPTSAPSQVAATQPTRPTRTSAPLFVIASNIAWTPVEQVVDGVPMVSVPAGCFMMGTAREPGGQQCFDAPFWIDKTEVSQAQFNQLGGTQLHASAFTGDNRPVDSILWQEALDFCVKRGGRLPTEAEWEYAARGPDGWLYPWGDTFSDGLGIFGRDSTLATADIASLPAGASWVGALDMSGNIAEWTMSRYRPYPYDKTDGREASAPQDSYTIRGGSWSDGRHSVSAVYRIGRQTTTPMNQIGFRCVLEG